MKNWVQKILHIAKQDAVLTIALLLAVISAFVVTPDEAYLEYIDFRTLALLFCLMAVMAGLQKLGVFTTIAGKLLAYVKSVGSLILVLMLLCFVSSMFITNDVALITFVPFTFTVLGMMDDRIRYKLAIPVVVMQTIAANLGSMLTPIGNPQNLYLYGQSGMALKDFLMLMLPYTLLSLVLLVIWGYVQGRRITDAESGFSMDKLDVSAEQAGQTAKSSLGVGKLVVYLVLFVLCLLTVARLLPYGVVLGIVVLVLLVMDRDVLRKVDYGLLLTFIGFFVFIGNMGRVPAFSHFLEQMIQGREVLTCVVSSQVISNVPAALLLSGFTKEYPALIVGTNLGGLGTLIASMASLISFKYIGKEMRDKKAAYLLHFTIGNLLFLAVLLGYHFLGLSG